MAANDFLHRKSLLLANYYYLVRWVPPPLFELRLKKFGLSKEQYETMLREQKGRCGLREEPLSAGWVIDHCHMTMKVRALLHPKCNTLLGMVNEDPRRLELAIAYFRRHNKFL